MLPLPRRLVVGLLGVGVAALNVSGASAASQTVLAVASGTSSIVNIGSPTPSQFDEGSYHSRFQLGSGRYAFSSTVSACDTGTGLETLTGTATLVRSDGATLKGTLTGAEGCVREVGVHFAVDLTSGTRDLAHAHLAFDGSISNVVAIPDGDRGDESLTVTGTLSTTTRVGWWSLGASGSVYAFGGVPFFGTIPRGPEGAGATRLEPTPSGNGYWIVNDRGQVYAFGDARWFGNADRRTWAGMTLETVVSIASTASGHGYWLFTNKGRVVPFGDAVHLGDVYPGGLAAHIAAAVATPSHRGYYLVGFDGGVFAYGDAKFRGSTGGLHLNSPIVGIAVSPTGDGYWLIASDGGVFAFGARYAGSLGGRAVVHPIVGGAAYGNGYVLVNNLGDVFNFSSQPFFGWAATNAVTLPPIAGIAAIG